MTDARAIGRCAAPGSLALLCYGLSFTPPMDSIAGQVAHALLLAAIPWLVLSGALVALLCGLFRARRRIWLPSLIAHLLLLGPPPAGEAPPEGLRVVSSNVDAFSPGPPGAEDALAALQAGVVFTIERRVEEIPGMTRVADNHAVPMKRPSHGTAVFCRPPLPCEAAVTAEFGSDSSIMPLGLLRVPVPLADGGQRPACLMGLHAPPPAPLDPTGLLPYIERVAGAIEGGRMARQWGPCLPGDPVLALGDFNHVRGGPATRRLRAAGLRHPSYGLGPWRATWPAGAGWPNLPVFELDQAMAGPDLRVLRLRRLRIPGADHKALVLDVLARR